MGPVKISRSCSGKESTILWIDFNSHAKHHFPSSLEVVHAQPDSDLGVLQQYVLKHGGVAILGQVLPGVIKVSETMIIDSNRLVTFSV